MSKDQWRKLIKQRSLFFDKNRQDRANIIIQEKIWEMLSGINSFAIYMNMEDEVATDLLIDKAFITNKLISSPKCIDNENMVMAKIDSRFKFTRGQLNIKEPTGMIIDKNEIEVIIVPMVAFDKCGVRIGHNKGYYDRYLSDYNGLMIGIAYQYQEVDSILKEDHDINMDMIITEQNTYMIA